MESFYILLYLPFYIFFFRFYIEKYQYVLAMLFAIDEINNSPELMPNVTLGYEVYDSCYSDLAALDAVMCYLSGEESKVPNYSCRSATPKLSAVVGDSPSSGSIAIARILGLTYFPQVKRKKNNKDQTRVCGLVCAGLYMQGIMGRTREIGQGSNWIDSG